MKTANNSRLFSLPVLIILIILVAAVLFVLYQYSNGQFVSGQSAEVLKSQYANPLQARYQQTLQGEPAAEDVMDLAEQLAKQGYREESAQLLAQKLPANLATDLSQRAAELRLKNALDSYYLASDAQQSLVTEESFLDVRAQLQTMGDFSSLSDEELATHAKHSVDFKLLPQAAQLYVQLAERTQQAQWWAEAAKWSEQGGDAVSAEAQLQQAMQTAGDAEEKQLYTHAWMQQAIKADKHAQVEAYIRKHSDVAVANEPEDLLQLAEISQRLGRPELTAQLYTQLAQQPSAEQQKWYEKAAYWFAQADLPQRSALLMQQAVQLADSNGQATEAHALRMRLLDTHLKADESSKALQIVDQLLVTEQDDQGLLDKGVNIALAAKDLPAARKWNQRYMQAVPEDSKAVVRQADIEMLAKNYRQAAIHIKEAVRLQPDNISLRERWAFLAEQQADKGLAMELWGWLHQHSGEPKYLKHQIRVAQGNLQGNGLLFLKQLAQQQPLPEQAVTDVFTVLAEQAPATAEAFLQDYLAQHAANDAQRWQQLAQWQIGMQRLPQALETWQQFEQRFGANQHSRLARLQLHWDLKQPEQAAAILPELDTQLAGLTPYQIEILADLSLQMKDYPAALAYYQHLVQQANAKTPRATLAGYYGQIASAQQALGQQDAALQTLQQLWQLTAKPEFLLEAMQLAFDNGNTPLLEQLFAQAKQQERQFELLPRYWLLQAQVALEQGNKRLARDFYEHLLVVAVQPDKVRKQALLQYLELVQQDADPKVFQKTFQELVKLDLPAKQLTRVYELALGRALENKDKAQLKALTQAVQQRQLAVAGWLQLAVAMHLEDKQAVANVLASEAELTLGDRFAALVLLERQDEAFDMARSAMNKADSAKEREQARKLALSLADGRVDSLQTGLEVRDFGNLNIQEQSLKYSKGQDQDQPFAYDVEVKHSRLSGADVNGGSQHEIDASLSVHLKDSGRQVDMTAGLNQRGAKTVPHANVRWREELSENLDGSLSYGHQETAQESAWLRANGTRNRWQADLDARLGENEYAQFSLWQSDFYGRDSEQALSESQGGRVTLVHRERLKNGQEWYAGVQASAEYYQTANGLAAQQQQALPGDTRNVALLAGISKGSPGSGIPPQDNQLNYAVNVALGKQLATGNTTQHVDASVGKRLSQDDELSVGAFYDQGDRTDEDYGVFVQYRTWLDFTDEENQQAVR